MIKKIILFLFLFPSISFGGSMNMIGEKGKAEEIDRIITVKTVSYTHLRAHETREDLGLAVMV